VNNEGTKTAKIETSKKQLALAGETKEYDLEVFPVINTRTRNIIPTKKLEELRKKNKSVAIVGFASAHSHQAPFDDPNIKIWGLNRMHQQDWFRKSDVMFQLHPINYLKECVGMSAGDRDHYDWLTKKHKFPIYCQEKYKEFPSSVRFPIEKMRQKYGDFYTSTAAYMMALALDQGYNHIELYGFNMSADTEYKHQRDSTEYFIGLIEGTKDTNGKLCNIYMTSNCDLINISGGMYGYETTEVGFRQLLEGRTIQLQNQRNLQGGEYNKVFGVVEFMRDIIKKYPELQPELDAAELNLVSQGALVNTVHGAWSESKETIKIFDAHYNNIGIEVDLEAEVSNDIEDSVIPSEEDNGIE